MGPRRPAGGGVVARSSRSGCRRAVPDRGKHRSAGGRPRSAGLGARGPRSQRSAGRPRLARGHLPDAAHRRATARDRPRVRPIPSLPGAAVPGQRSRRRRAPSRRAPPPLRSGPEGPRRGLRGRRPVRRLRPRPGGSRAAGGGGGAPPPNGRRRCRCCGDPRRRCLLPRRLRGREPGRLPKPSSTRSPSEGDATSAQRSGGASSRPTRPSPGPQASSSAGWISRRWRRWRRSAAEWTSAVRLLR